MTTGVSLNGVDLVEGKDYYWIPGKLVLFRPRPKAYSLSFWEKVQRIVTGNWEDAFRVPVPYPDFVSVENWSHGIRETYFSGSKDFDKYVCYAEDLEVK